MEESNKVKKFKVWANPSCYTEEHNSYMAIAIDNFPGTKCIKTITEEGQKVWIYAASSLAAGFIEHLSICDDIWAVEIKEGV